MSFLAVVGSALMLGGAVLSFLAALGLLDFPSALSRMHAATKSASLGLALVAVGAGVAAESWGLVGIGVLVTGFLFMTAPISGHLLGRAIYAAGQVEDLIHDDLATRQPQVAYYPPEPQRRFSVWRLLPLVVVWVLLWRDATAGVWIGGLAVAIVIELIRRLSSRDTRVRPLSLLRFVAHYAGMVVVSNVRVAWEVVTPNNDQIREAIVAVPLRSKSVSVALLVANAISYTPGSLTVALDEDPLVLYVHVLHFETTDLVRAEVGRLEELAAAALNEDLTARSTSPRPANDS